MQTLIAILVLISFNLFAEEGEKLGQWTYEEIMGENKEKNSLEFLETIEEEKKLEEYSHNAKKLVQEKFLLKNKIKEYEKMFEDVIEKFNIRKN